MKNNQSSELFSLTKSDVEKELFRITQKGRVLKNIRIIILFLFGIASVAILVSFLMFPLLRIYGSSMTPTLYEGDVVVCYNTNNLESGDLIAFYFENNILVKRYIAGPGQWVDIDKEGNVYVDSKKLDEPYIADKAFGDCDIELPYQVPESRVFCMGDYRSVSIDSRNQSVGCIFDDKIVGKVIFRIFPFNDIEVLN